MKQEIKWVDSTSPSGLAFELTILITDNCIIDQVVNCGEGEYVIIYKQALK